MTTTIYYFTGTGNSLHAARTIAHQLGESRLVNIARANGTGSVEDKGQNIGFVFPVYYGDMPGIVRDFVKGIVIDPQSYVFAVVTSGGGPLVTLFTLETLLENKGVRLSAGFNLTMPDNAYVYANFVTPPEKRGPVLEASERGLAEIVEAVKRKEVRRPGNVSRLATKTQGLLLKPVAGLLNRVYRMPGRFWSDDRCTGCGICVRVCPTGNVVVREKQVSWGDDCTHCLACFHWCPRQAIQQGNRSKSIARYHHPDITIGSIVGDTKPDN